MAASWLRGLVWALRNAWARILRWSWDTGKGLLPEDLRRRVRRVVFPNLEPPGRLPWRPQAGGSDAAGAQRLDVLCLPCIDWDFRRQRPQHLMAQFSRQGHRVFVAALTFRSPRRRLRLEQREEGIWKVFLQGPFRDVYAEYLDDAALACFEDSVAGLKRREDLRTVVVVVQLPFWWPLARRLREKYGWPVVYDCMDEVGAFPETGTAMLASEAPLAEAADLVVASSRVLAARLARLNPGVILVRNGCDPAFLQVPDPPADARKRVLGYTGAVSGWFDVNLVAELARRRPDWVFHLVGAVQGVDCSSLRSASNVVLFGERPYQEMPVRMADFDLVLLPFLSTPLTLATNPVKVYEAMAAGRPVIATPLPEVEEMKPLVDVAEGVDGFEAAAVRLLADASAVDRGRRRRWAAQHTWERRFQQLWPAVRGCFPSVSVIMVTFNQWEVTRQCLESLERCTEWPNFELVVVDNGSGDGTVEGLAEFSERFPDTRILRNPENRGFAAATNQGVELSNGEYLVLLNNDTVVTRGWMTGLVGHLRRDEGLGMVCPSTNAIANRARVPVPYQSLDEMHVWAARFTASREGQIEEMESLALFCAALHRSLWERLGPLDDGYGLGLFEDDDYCARVREAGLRLGCARDTFVHHWMGASFASLGSEDFRDLFLRNRLRFETRWGRPWHGEAPHGV